MHPTFLCERTYKNPTKVLSVDIEAELNAGHSVDPESDIQFCAIATGEAASIDSNAVLVLNPLEPRSLLLGPPLFPSLDAIVRSRGDRDDSINSKCGPLREEDDCIEVSLSCSGLSSLIFRSAVFPQLHLRASFLSPSFRAVDRLLIRATA